MTITIYYIDKKWNWISKLVDIKLFTKIYNAVYLAEILNDIIKSFENTDKIHTYVFISYFFFFFFFFFLNSLISRFFKKKITINKAGNNLSFAKQFRLDYKYKYNINIYNVKCVTYTFNNVMKNVIN